MRLMSLMLLGALIASQTFADSASLRFDQNARKYNLGFGRWVFANRCMDCHGTGELGAPRFREPVDWAGRLKQELPVLIEHAMKGHGEMSAKGGFEKLTEREVAAAVAYVVDQSRQVVLQAGTPSSAKSTEKVIPKGAEGGCDPIANIERCSTKELEDALLLQMLWLLAGGES